MKQDELKAFIGVFMRTFGGFCSEDQVVNFIKHRDHGVPDAQLYKEFGSEIYSSVLDALDIWETARGVK
jgi:hypothetical protein